MFAKKTTLNFTVCYWCLSLCDSKVLLFHFFFPLGYQCAVHTVQCNLLKLDILFPLICFSIRPECPPLPPSMGHICVARDAGAQDCRYEGGNGGEIESPLVVNCCCNRCDTDRTCDPDSTTGFGHWKSTHSTLCPAEGCGSQGEWLKCPSSWVQTPYHQRSYYLPKLPCQLSWQPWADAHDTSGGGTDPVVRLHCIQHWVLLRLPLWPPDNHGWRWDDLDGISLWLKPAEHVHQQKQHCQPPVQYRLERNKGWLESKLECSGTRWDMRQNILARFI